MKNKRNIFLFIIWTISYANSITTDYRYLSKTRQPGKPRHTTTWSLNFPNPAAPLNPFLSELSQIFRNPQVFPFQNNFYQPPGHHSHQHPFTNFEHYPHYPNYEIHHKPHEPEAPPFTHVENNKPPFTTFTEAESSTVFQMPQTNKPQSNDNAVLVDSLNKALHKLNGLLPLNSNKEKNPTFEIAPTQNPATVNPEELADSLHKAIDMLSEVLATQSPNTQNKGTIQPPAIMDPLMPLKPMVSQNEMNLSLEEAIKELEKLFIRLPDELKNPHANANPNNPPIIGIGHFHPIFVPRPIVNGGIPEGTKKPTPPTSTTTTTTTTTEAATLFTSSQDEIVETTTPESTTLFTSNNLFTSSNNLFTSSRRDKNKNKGMPSTTPMSIESSESSESSATSESEESTESSEEEDGLFTSIPKLKNETDSVTTPSSATEDALFTSSPKESMLFTSSPKNELFTSSPANDMLFTSSPKNTSTAIRTNQETSTETSSETSTETSSETIISSESQTIKTEHRIKEDEVPTTTEVFIDIRFGEGRSDDAIVFPDDYDDDRIPDRISPSFIHENELNLANRFSESNSQQTKPSDSVNLANLNTEDKNSGGFQPPGHNPFLIISDKNTQQNNQIILEYQPNRPSFQPEPLVYPMPAIPPGEPLPGSSTERNNFQQLGDRNSVPPTTTQRYVTSNHQTNTPISLEYKPMRPFFAGPVMYPQPLIPPGEPLPGSSTERNNFQQLGDRNSVPPTTTTQRYIDDNTPISLEYKPSRPPYAPNPVVYPMPGNFQQLGDRNQIPTTTTTTTPRPTTRTTRRPYHTNTPIVLGYKPSRPPYVPDPWIYPSPGLIPPGTPWPASSTERPFGK